MILGRNGAMKFPLQRVHLAQRVEDELDGEGEVRWQCGDQLRRLL